jgi:hypothetical protein
VEGRIVERNAVSALRVDGHKFLKMLDVVIDAICRSMLQVVTAFTTERPDCRVAVKAKTPFASREEIKCLLFFRCFIGAAEICTIGLWFVTMAK